MLSIYHFQEVMVVQLHDIVFPIEMNSGMEYLLDNLGAV